MGGNLSKALILTKFKKIKETKEVLDSLKKTNKPYIKTQELLNGYIEEYNNIITKKKPLDEQLQIDIKNAYAQSNLIGKITLDDDYLLGIDNTKGGKRNKKSKKRISKRLVKSRKNKK
jgi:hypothetical protein